MKAIESAQVYSQSQAWHGSTPMGELILREKWLDYAWDAVSLTGSVARHSEECVRLGGAYISVVRSSKDQTLRYPGYLGAEFESHRICSSARCTTVRSSSLRTFGPSRRRPRVGARLGGLGRTMATTSKLSETATSRRCRAGVRGGADLAQRSRHWAFP